MRIDNEEARIMLVSILSLMYFLSVGCDIREQAPPQGDRVKFSGYTTVIIEQCEYIEVDEGILQLRVYSLTHKGNCKNPIHKR